ncbi:helix-turn-helix domain-containing protein [Microbacterium sp. A84]|uniref:helix-turn-helix domain-containing protein n=1 Tax=Microbacterium sp. A84 TaxID=3450715 RepID=UPI003F442911
MQHTTRLRTPGDIGLALQQARLAQGWTQNELAAETDLPQSTISAIENGMSTIHLRRLLELARRTGLSITATWEDVEAGEGNALWASSSRSRARKGAPR